MHNVNQTVEQTPTIVSTVVNNWSAIDRAVYQEHTSVFMALAFLVYLCGVSGRLFNYKNFLVTRISVELRYLGVITSFVRYGVTRNDPRGAVYGLLILILAACESAVGLGIIIVLYRFGSSIDFSAHEELGG